MRFRFGLLALALCLAPVPAWADGFVSPYIGYDFGGDAGNCPNVTNCASKKANVGGSVGFMGGGVFGFEEDVSYAPHFFGKSPSFGDNSVLTAMTNVIVGVPLGPVRPYLSAGVGAVRTKVNLDPSNVASFQNTGLGYDVGGGLMMFFASHAGLRGDYRYFRGTRDMTIAGFSINGTKLNFSRASVGVVFRF